MTATTTKQPTSAINTFGKILVLIHGAISILALAGAAGIFLQFLDWGWKEPREEAGTKVRIPAEYDKRAAAWTEAKLALDGGAAPEGGPRAGVRGGLKKAQDALIDIQPYYYLNHLVYQDKLDALREGPDPVEVKDVKVDDKDKTVVLSTKYKYQPEFQETKVAGVDKCYLTYQADFRDVHKSIVATSKEIGDWIEKEKKLTLQLNGEKTEKGEVVKTGLYALLDEEKKIQDQAWFELDYLRPTWAWTLKEAEVYRLRRQRLESTLSRVQKATAPVSPP